MMDECRVLELAAQCSTLEDAARVMEAGGIIHNGITCVGMPEAERVIAYVNRGDTYDTTILQEGTGPLEIGSWGGWFEAAEEEYKEEEGVINCGYCGGYSECEDGVEYHDIVCSLCGHKVSGD